MNTSSEAAEQVIRISLQGIEVAARLSGSGAKNIAALLVAIAKDQQKVKGKTTLTNMLKSGRPLKVFSIKKEELKKFSDEAKRYGVLFSAILEKDSKDGLIDIMVKEEDSSKINRIVERFKLATVDRATIQSEVEKIMNEKTKGYEPQSTEKKQVEENKNKVLKKDENTNTNPSMKVMTEKNQSKPSSKNKKNLEVSTKKSVKKEIDDIKKELSKASKHKHIKKERTK